MKKIIVFGIILLISICLSGVIYTSTAVAGRQNESLNLVTQNQRVENHKKVDERLCAVWQDIKKLIILMKMIIYNWILIN
jgi:uncharacterized protein YxeA